MIIVEGPDGGGKTHLVTRLSHAMNLPIAPKVVDSNTNAMEDLVRWVDWNLEQGLTPTLYDRHRLISEPIYGPVLRDRPSEGFENYSWLKTRQAQFREAKPLIIWCLPPVDVVLGNVMGDDANVVVQDRIQAIYWLYYMAATQWKSHSILWDYTRHNFDALVIDITDWMKRKNLA